jgi:molybdate transport system substrate-binding protein
MKIRRDIFPRPSVLEIAPFAQVADATTAEIKVWGPRVIATVLWEIGSQFELATGHQLDIASDLPDTFIRWMNAAEPFDVLVGTPPLIDDLTKNGKIAAESRTTLARSSIGVEVRAGAPNPDIGSVEAFKRTLLDAKSIAYLKIGGGLYVQGMLERLGIYDAIKSKVTRPDADIVSELVAKGDVELGMVNISQILTTSGVQLVGLLPRELQSDVVFVAGVSANSIAREASRSLIQFLTGPIAVAIIQSQGMKSG